MPDTSEEAMDVICKVCEKEFDNHEEAIDHVYEAHKDAEECAWCSRKRLAEGTFGGATLASHMSS